MPAIIITGKYLWRNWIWLTCKQGYFFEGYMSVLNLFSVKLQLGLKLRVEDRRWLY